MNIYEGGKTLGAKPIEMDANVEKIAVERLTKFKEKRDNNKTKAALENMKDVAEKMKDGWPNGPDLMPAAIEAADADLSAQAESRRNTLVSVLAEVALNYVELRVSQAQLTSAEQNEALQEESLKIVQAQFSAGNMIRLVLCIPDRRG